MNCYLLFNNRIVRRPLQLNSILIRAENATKRVGVPYYQDSQRQSFDCVFFDVETRREFVCEINVHNADEYVSAILNDAPFLDWLERVRTLPFDAELPDVYECPTDRVHEEPGPARLQHDVPYVENGVLLSPNGIDLTLDDDYWRGHDWNMKRRESGLFARMNRLEKLSKELTEQVDREREERELVERDGTSVNEIRDH